MRNQITFIFLFLCAFTFVANGQTNTNSKDAGVLRFREEKTLKIVDYLATIISKDDNIQGQIEFSTLKDTNLIPGKYKVTVHTLPEFKATIIMNSNIIYEIQLPEQGIVRVTNLKKGTLRFYRVRGNEVIEPAFKTFIQEDSIYSLKLAKGVYKVLRQIDNVPNLEEFFKIYPYKETIISLD